MVEQVPPASARDAIRPAMEALVADGLLRHADIEVKVSVASCISEIMRITAPDGPYDESRLKANTTHTAFFCPSWKSDCFPVSLLTKLFCFAIDGSDSDFFELAVLAFGKLSCLDGRCYSKAVSIIEVLAKYRMCVLMLDLELDALIVQMFQHFLNSLRPDHPDKVFMDITEIMSIIIEESDEIPLQLLNILISSVEKENQNVSPRSYVLGEKVLQKSAVKLHPYLPKAVRSLGISINNYSEVVELIWRGAIKSKATSAIKFLPKSGLRDSDQFGNGASKSQVENAAKKELDSEATHASRKRAWKPNFLNKPDEGYDHAWSSGGRRSKAHNLLKGRGKDAKKRSSCSQEETALPLSY